jgi:hypothetical protein
VGFVVKNLFVLLISVFAIGFLVNNVQAQDLYINKDGVKHIQTYQGGNFIRVAELEIANNSTCKYRVEKIVFTIDGDFNLKHLNFYGYELQDNKLIIDNLSENIIEEYGKLSFHSSMDISKKIDYPGFILIKIASADDIVIYNEDNERVYLDASFPLTFDNIEIYNSVLEFSNNDLFLDATVGQEVKVMEFDIRSSGSASIIKSFYFKVENPDLFDEVRLIKDDKIDLGTYKIDKKDNLIELQEEFGIGGNSSVNLKIMGIPKISGWYDNFLSTVDGENVNGSKSGVRFIFSSSYTTLKVENATSVSDFQEECFKICGNVAEVNLSKAKTIALQVHDPYGKKIKTINEYGNVGKNSVPLNLKPGLYIVVFNKNTYKLLVD